MVGPNCRTNRKTLGVLESFKIFAWNLIFFSFGEFMGFPEPP